MVDPTTAVYRYDTQNLLPYSHDKNNTPASLTHTKLLRSFDVCCKPEQADEQRIDVISDAITLIWHHCNVHPFISALFYWHWDNYTVWQWIILNNMEKNGWHESSENNYANKSTGAPFTNMV